MSNAMQALIVVAAGAVLPESAGQQQQDRALMDAQLDLGGGYIAEDPSNWLLSVRCLIAEDPRNWLLSLRCLTSSFC